MPMKKSSSTVLAVLIAVASAATLTGTLGTASGYDYAIPVVIISPQQSPAAYEIVLEDSLGDPIVGASVKLHFPPELVSTLSFCDVPDTTCELVLEDTTGSNGVATFAVYGGGCWDEVSDPTLGYMVAVSVNDSIVAYRGVRSPDIVDLNQERADQLWCQNPPEGSSRASVGTEDAAWFGEFIADGVYSPCADMDGDGKVSAADASTLAPALKYSDACGGP